MTLPEAIRKMTSLPASRLGLKDRGIIRVGMKADLVLFDPAAILDMSTFERPRLRSRGVEAVFVNGVPVLGADRPDGPLPGRVLVRPTTRRSSDDDRASRSESVSRANR